MMRLRRSLDSRHSKTILLELKEPHLTINMHIVTSILKTHNTHRPNDFLVSVVSVKDLGELRALN